MIPSALASEVARKSNEELQAMVDKPDDWLPEVVAMARAELLKRGVVLSPPPLPVIELEAESPPEPVDYRFRVNAGILGGLAIGLIGGFTKGMDWTIRFPISITMISCSIWACSAYAVGKGYSRWFGVLGILSCLGLLPILFLPDRRKEYDDHFG